MNRSKAKVYFKMNFYLEKQLKKQDTFEGAQREYAEGQPCFTGFYLVLYLYKKYSSIVTLQI